MQTRTCKKCGMDLPLTRAYFGTYRNRAQDEVRFRGGCKDCWNIYQAQRRAENPPPPLTLEQRANKRAAAKRCRDRQRERKAAERRRGTS